MKLSLLLAACLAALPSIGSAATVEVVRLPAGTLQPVAVTDSEGTVHWVWLQGEPAACDVFYQRWPGGVPPSTPPLRVNSRPGSAIAIGTVRGAQITLGRAGRIHVVWNGSSKAETSPGDGAPLLYSRLDDSGTTFEASRNLRGSTFHLDGGASVAADSTGNVTVVWHAAIKRDNATEKDRRVFAIRSIDEGTTFLPAGVLTPDGGVCGCCGLRAFSDSADHLAVLYRSAGTGAGRPMILLSSTTTTQGTAVQQVLSDPWPIEACPMSTAALIAGPGQVLAAWETEGRIRFTSLKSGTSAARGIESVSDGSRARHPALAVNQSGQILCAWAEGTGWQRGGEVAWRTWPPGDGPAGVISRQPGLSAWSSPAAFARPDGTFVVAY